MTDSRFEPDRFRKVFLLLLLAAITIAFLYMVKGFFSAIMLAAISTGLALPMQNRLVALFRGRAGLAAVVSLFVVVGVIIGPLLTFLGVVASQAVEVSELVRPWLQAKMGESVDPSALQRLELPEFLQPYQTELTSRLSTVAAKVVQFVFDSLTAATRGTAHFLLQLFVMLYAMFFFLRDGRSILSLILYYMPLKSEDEMRMVGKFVSVSRATIKGSFVIGIVQGTLAGLAFWVVGVPGSAFWGTVMAVLSIIPGIGTALVWVPAAIWLWATGEVTGAIGLSLWCAAVVGTVDNVLRPRLVGADTEMSDLLIMLSTLGGLVVFGAIGIVVGPILAALFVTVWELYGEAFAEYLPDVELPGGHRPVPPEERTAAK